MDLIKQAGQALATFAPTIASALGGPLAGVAVSSLEKVFGVDPAATAVSKQAQIEQSLQSATPDQIIALQKAEQDFKAQMKSLGVQEEQLQYQDTANARAREISVRDRTPAILAGAVVLMTFALEGSLLMGWHQPAQVSGEILGRILGTLDSATLLVLSYYFGSSAGARTKDDTINTLSKQ